MNLNARMLICLAAALTGFVAVETPARADTIPFTIAESDTQPKLLPFMATLGTVLLCDGTGAGSATPRMVGGSWGCYGGLASSPILKAASDIITFSANPGDAANPSKVTFCSDVDPIVDPADVDPLCRGVNLTVTGNFALLEMGTERTGPEETPYEPTRGMPGYGTYTPGSTTFTVTYDLISDPATAVPEPDSLALFGPALLASGLLWRIGRRKRSRA